MKPVTENHEPFDIVWVRSADGYVSADPPMRFRVRKIIAPGETRWRAWDGDVVVNPDFASLVGAKIECQKIFDRERVRESSLERFLAGEIVLTEGQKQVIRAECQRAEERLREANEKFEATAASVSIARAIATHGTDVMHREAYARLCSEVMAWDGAVTTKYGRPVKMSLGLALRAALDKAQDKVWEHSLLSQYGGALQHLSEAAQVEAAKDFVRTFDPNAEFPFHRNVFLIDRLGGTPS